MNETSVLKAREFDGATSAILIALGGFALMYAPVYWAAAHDIWRSDENGHGPLILIVDLWLFWTVRQAVLDSPNVPRPWLGWPLFTLGLLVYTAGRALDIVSIEFASQMLIVSGALFLIKGVPAFRVAWFPALYLVFSIPLPATLVDAVTGPLKHLISAIVQRGLYALDYPIGNSGVVLTIGQYQLMVADACSGLNSMFSLSALGTLFMYIMKRPRVGHNVIMLASILPIAFVANIVRVTFLVLLTYHFGDEAGQGFLHGAAGIALMAVALLLLVLLDKILVAVCPHGSSAVPASGI